MQSLYSKLFKAAEKLETKKKELYLCEKNKVINVITNKIC